MRLSPVYPSIVVALAALLFSAAAKAATYQITITPELDPNFSFGPGEPSDQFFSDFQDIDFTGSLAPPQFLQAVITLNGPEINTNGATEFTNTTSTDMPEANPLSNIPLGDNLVAPPQWYVFESQYSDLPPGNDEYDLELDTGTPGLDPEWDIDLIFPAGADGNGTALSGTITYYDGVNNFTGFYLESAVMTQIVPEPASLALLSCLGIGLLSRKRR